MTSLHKIKESFKYANAKFEHVQEAWGTGLNGVPREWLSHIMKTGKGKILGSESKLENLGRVSSVNSITKAARMVSKADSGYVACFITMNDSPVALIVYYPRNGFQIFKRTSNGKYQNFPIGGAGFLKNNELKRALMSAMAGVDGKKWTPKRGEIIKMQLITKDISREMKSNSRAEKAGKQSIQAISNTVIAKLADRVPDTSNLGLVIKQFDNLQQSTIETFDDMNHVSVEQTVKNVQARKTELFAISKRLRQFNVEFTEYKKLFNETHKLITTF